MKIEDLIANIDLRGKLEAIEDMKALHGINVAKELTDSIAEEVAVKHDAQLGREFADAVMAKLKEPGAAREIFRTKAIPPEWRPAIECLKVKMLEMTAFVEWLDEIQMGNVYIAVNAHVEGEEYKAELSNVMFTLDPCSEEHFERMQVKQRAPRGVAAFIGEDSVLLRLRGADFPRMLMEWFGSWVQERIYAQDYAAGKWGIHTNNREPRTFNLEWEATNLYAVAKGEEERAATRARIGSSLPIRERGKELIEWLDKDLQTIP